MSLPALPFVPEAVIFDMDGLMLDSERAMLRSWTAAAAETGRDIDPSQWLRMVGHGDAVCLTILEERMSAVQARELMARCQALYEMEMEAGLPLRPGVLELLQWLAQRGIRCGVATSTHRPRAPRKLQAAGLADYFDAIATGNDVTKSKPAPDIYLLAAQRLGVAPARCLALEDSPTGVRAALAAGMHAVQVPDLVAPDEEVRAWGHTIIASLHDVRDMLERRLAA
ncbi:HAD family phosphatase [Pseudoxanthomonas helianthi]|uniref:HAD family phosphatase n=1 Tax=Pseudoxanthomonas helianthi TaxID=1453541 RepID=A0A941AT49_9GAMM|nr:HAD family phosphatase [Pseudoxanthomonas helianthi]MBP3983567.1 HAD family phosphatase [Pseudoxanthomonas helianthi]